MQEGDFPPPGRPAPEDEGVSHAGGHGSDPGISGDGFRPVCVWAGPEPADREDSGEKCGPGWGSDSGEASGAGYYGRKQTRGGNGAGENGVGGDPGGRSGNVYGPGHRLGRRGRQKSGPVRDVRLWRADGGRLPAPGENGRKRRRCHAFICGSAGLEAGAVCSGRAFGGMKMGKKGYALVEAVTAVALVMMASGILSLGISFGLRMERRAEQLKNTETVWEVPARFRMRTWDGTVISGEGCVRRQTVTGRNRELFIYGFGMEPGTGELERQSLDSVFSDQRETE